MKNHIYSKYDYRILFFMLCLLFCTPSLMGQSEWEPLISSQETFQKRAMYVLGGWGLANAISGGIGMATTEGTTKYFHQMNLGWGVINAGIAVAGYLGAREFNLGDPVGMALLNKNLSMSKAFLFNAGLDVGYMAGGLYLRERSKNISNLPERMKGFGNSIILQGAFLFTFDLVAYFLNNQKTKGIQDFMIEMGGTENGFGLILSF